MTGPTATANIFATYLPDRLTLWMGFLDEVSGPVWVPLLNPPHLAGSPHNRRDKNSG